MPVQSRSATKPKVATKQVLHGDPCIEKGVPGSAAKSQQSPGGVPNAANALAHQTIIVGEPFVIECKGEVSVRDALLPALTEGLAIYIQHSNNALVGVATAVTGGVLNAGFSRFGVIIGDDPSSAAHTLVDLDLRSAF